MCASSPVGPRHSHGARAEHLSRTLSEAVADVAVSVLRPDGSLV